MKNKEQSDKSQRKAQDTLEVDDDSDCENHSCEDEELVIQDTNNTNCSEPLTSVIS